MDPFTEKDMIECLRAISATLNNIDSRLEELTLAVREIGLGLEGNEEDDLASREEESQETDKI